MSDAQVPVAASAVLEAGRVQAGMSVAELWMAYFALGGSREASSVRAYLRGDYEIAATDYDLLAQAVNERFLDQGGDHPVPYGDELAR